MRIAFICLLFFTVCFTVELGSTQSDPQTAQQTLSTDLADGLKLYRTGKFDDAITKYQSVIQQQPKVGEAYAGLARCYLKQEKIAEALDTAKKGVTEDPASNAARTALGEVLFRQGLVYEADVEWVKVANSPGPDARSYLGIFRLDNAMSLYASARRMIDRAHQLDPGDPEVQRGWLSTLPRDQRMKMLEAYLSQPTIDDVRTRESLEHELTLLKAEETGPSHSCRLVNDVHSTEEKLERLLMDPDHLRGYGLRVNLNGQMAKLLLDTGASGILINHRIADRAQIKPLVKLRMSGVGDQGDIGAYIGYADSIKIGALEFQNCIVEVSEQRSLAGGDGLIGADVLDHFLITLDFPNEKLTLGELPRRPDDQAKTPAHLNTGEDEKDSSTTGSGRVESAHSASSSVSAQPAVAIDSEGVKDRYIAPQMKSFTKVYRFSQYLLIPTILDDRPQKLFLIDSGGMMNMISKAAAQEVTKIWEDSHMHLRGISGSVRDVYSADDVTIQFAHFRQKNIGLVAFDLSSISRNTGTEVSGILGFTLLRMLQIKIDYRDGLVDFEYNPIPWQR